MQFHIARMSCGGCVETIRKAILGIDGNARVDADIAAKTVEVETSAHRDDVARALATAGYPATGN